jgi:hypothetical protein
MISKLEENPIVLSKRKNAKRLVFGRLKNLMATNKSIFA